MDIPARLARVAKEAGVKNFLHVSALAQDLESPSRWARTKVRRTLLWEYIHVYLSYITI